MEDIPFQGPKLGRTRQRTGKAAVLFPVYRQPGFRIFRFHSLQHPLLTQKQARANPFFTALLLNLLRCHGSVRREIGGSCREILHTGAGRVRTQQHRSFLFQRKEVQQHLQAHALGHIAIIKTLLTGFVVCNPDEASGALLPGIHPVHKAPKPGFHFPTGYGNGRHFSVLTEGHLKPDRRKRGLRQFLPKLLHNHVQFLKVAPEKGLASLGIHPLKPLPGIGIRVLPGKLQGLFQTHLMEAPQLHHLPAGIFQNGMDIGAELCRIHLGLLPLLRPQAVFQEIQQAALGLGIHLGGGELQFFPVKGLDGFRLDSPQPVIRLRDRIPIGFRQAQRLGRILLPPPGKPGPRFPGIGPGKFQAILHRLGFPGHLAQPPEEIGGLFSAAIHPHGLGSSAEHAVNLREFLLNALHGPAGKGHSQLAQGHTLLIGQDPLGPGITGKAALLGTQQQQVPAFVAPQSRNRAHLHRIQYRRDGAYIVLAQKQTEQPEKMLRLPVGLTQNIVHLLQGRQQNLPQLVENLGAAVVPRLIQRIRHFLQPLLQRNIL